MTTQLERIEYELKLAGYDLVPRTELKSDDDYVQQIANCAYEICKIFCSQNHSGTSAHITLQMIYTLLSGKTLTVLTNNPCEWVKISEESDEVLYQSKRKFSCFSNDLIEYWDNDDEENIIRDVDENGISYTQLKPLQYRLRVKLQDYKELNNGN